MVFGARAAKDTIARLPGLRAPEQMPAWDTRGAVQSTEEVMVSYTWDEVRRLMWNLVGIVRNDRRLELARRRIGFIHEEVKDYYWKFLLTNDLIELRNIALVAELVIRSALVRKESRGLHYTLDYPNRDDVNWNKDTVLSIGSAKESRHA